MTSSLDIRSERLAAYLEGQVDPTERAAIERALQDSPDVRGRLKQMRQIASVLSAPNEHIENIDLLPHVRQALAERSAAAAERPSHWRLGMLAVVAASCLALAVGLQRQAPVEPAFRAKSLHGSTSDSRRWAGIQIHRALSDTEVRRVASSIAARDQLLFSYTNLGSQPFGFLMVFALDQAGRAYWFYPSYDNPGDDPASVAIAPGGARTLPDLIEHDYPPGPLTVHALFTRQALHVGQIEVWLRAGYDKLRARLPSDAHLQTEVLQVSE